MNWPPLSTSEINRRMRVLLIHNFYGSEAPSGENVVFSAEKELLESRGHEVQVHLRFSDDIRKKGGFGKVVGAASTPWNPVSSRRLRELISKFQPQVVHAHNTFPLISPSVFHTVGLSAAKVLTLHNYRLLCPAAIPMRNGVICTECIRDKSVLPSLIHGCYRESRMATLPIAIGVALHRFIGTWERKIDAFIALSEFQRELMSSGGLPYENIYVKPNFYPGDPKVVSFDDRGDYVVFVGRLGQEKGVHTLVQAWRKWRGVAPRLRFIGDGPLRNELEKDAENLPIEFLGQISYEEVQKQIANARMLILPSECFEGFPMVLREAFALGTPVAVSNLGPLPSIVQHGENGVVFLAGNADELNCAVEGALLDLDALKKMSKGARVSFEKLYNEEANYRMLIEIYEKALETNKRKKS